MTVLFPKATLWNACYGLKMVDDETGGVWACESDQSTFVLSGGRKDEVFLNISSLALPFLDTRENNEHTRISCEIAGRLIREECADRYVVFPAIILHDVGWKCVPEDLQANAFGPGAKDMALNSIHEREGARIAAEILAKVNYPAQLIREVYEIVLGHDSRHVAFSLNDAVVKDSDKLWRFSEHGVRINYRRFKMSIGEYLGWLRTNLETWFFTITAKRMAWKELQAREQLLESNG